jgi:Zn-dependent peptidase ImmA (M78 family)
MFRRGFKTWSEQTSLRARQRLKLSASSPLDPFRLAELLGVFVLQPQELSGLSDDIRFRLATAHSDCWSAITVSDGNRHLIVINSSHAKTRLNSSLAHELAHIILGHEPSMMFMSSTSGMALRTYNEDQEEEANWLGGCLLLPREALLAIRRNGRSDEDACDEYEVSPAMLRFRINVTGVDSQFRRSRRYGRHRSSRR